MTGHSNSTINALEELARQIRNGTLQLLRVPEPSWLTWSPAGTSNHMLWHAGHALWLQDALTIRLLTGRSELPPGWEEKFGQHCRPVSKTTDWPPPDEVYTRLNAQLQRILTLFSEHAERITRSTDETSQCSGWPLLPGILHGWHDEARHQGEMYLLYKLRRASH